MSSYKIPLRARLIIVTAVLASLLEIIDTSIVNVAVPTMMGNLGATLDEISWVITGYIIANAIVLPIAGWMSQQLGRKFYYTSCIILFTVASVACGLAPNLATLVLCRVVQGFAGGALLPTSQALIYEAFPAEQAGMAWAIYGMSVMIGPTLGPTLGGYLTDHFGWRSIFNINIPIGFVCSILSILLVEDVGELTSPTPKKSSDEPSVSQKKRQRIPIDYLGLALLMAGIGSLQYVLERGNADDWFESGTITFLSVVAVLSLIGLIWWELKTPHPILQLRHFKIINFRWGVFLMGGLGAMLYGLLFIVPIFVANVQGLTATQTGELFIPGAIAAALIMPWIGNQLRIRDARQLIFVGVLTLSLALVLISGFDSQTSVRGMFWPLLVRGLAMSFLFVPINTVVLSEFTGYAIGEAAGMLNLFRQLGGSIGIAILSTLFQRFLVQDLSHLSNHLTWFDPGLIEAHRGIAAALHHKFMNELGFGESSLQATKILYGRAHKQAFVLAYQSTLMIGVCAYLFTLIPLWRMRKSSKLTVSNAH